MIQELERPPLPLVGSAKFRRIREFRFRFPTFKSAKYGFETTSE